MRLTSLTKTVGFLAMGLLGAGTAQADIFGHWDPIMHEDQLERGPGPNAGDYAGLPINDAARLRADTWTASLLTVPEHQCKPHPSTYGFRGIGNLRVWQIFNEDSQQLEAIGTHISWMAQRRTIWMDGREHPDAMAPHTWQGFSTGHFEGETLVVRTTHLKQTWMRRNGLMFSDQAEMLEYFTQHGDTMTHTMIVTDPVYLEAPFVKTNGFGTREATTMAPYPCRPTTEIDRPVGEIPHNMLGESTYGREFSENNHVPYEAGRGGGITMLPEYWDVVRQWTLDNMTYEERMGDGFPFGNER